MTNDVRFLDTRFAIEIEDVLDYNITSINNKPVLREEITDPTSLMDPSGIVDYKSLRHTQDTSLDTSKFDTSLSYVRDRKLTFDSETTIIDADSYVLDTYNKINIDANAIVDIIGEPDISGISREYNGKKVIDSQLGFEYTISTGTDGNDWIDSTDDKVRIIDKHGKTLWEGTAVSRTITSGM